MKLRNEPAFLERVRARQRKRGWLTFSQLYTLSGKPSQRISWWEFEKSVDALVRRGKLRVINDHFFVDDNEHIESAVMLERKKKLDPPAPRQLQIAGIE